MTLEELLLALHDKDSDLSCTKQESTKNYEQHTQPFVFDCIKQGITDISTAISELKITAPPNDVETALIELAKLATDRMSYTGEIVSMRDTVLLNETTDDSYFPDSQLKTLLPSYLAGCQEVTQLSFRCFQDIREPINFVATTTVGTTKETAEKLTLAIDTFIDRCRQAFTDGPQILTEKRPDGKWSVRARYQSTLAPR